MSSTAKLKSQTRTDKPPLSTARHIFLIYIVATLNHERE